MNYLFYAYYYNKPKKQIKVQSSNRTKAYEIATKKAIKIDSNFDFVELQ
jgi:hypothetical protein